MNDCIETVKDKGIKKREWKHIFITTHPALFWTIFSGLLAFAFWVGNVSAIKSQNAPSYGKEYKKVDSTHIR